ncbi:hypothetical protein AAFF_G00081920 [Aldrovandia affinis]|uniref:ZP-C domain-containing protein n=1 Tax=Aldrovandia affinis TaxID=143900 RepID=A0AAD7WYI8_9TELE|nr:hypothetical protein AAFF_G00081920 [Aldrovandia affinis]
MYAPVRGGGVSRSATEAGLRSSECAVEQRPWTTGPCGARLACRQVVVPSGVPAGVRWDRVSGGGAPGVVRDLHWRCALGVAGARGPVPTRLHCECSVSRGCGAPETVSHVFWGCPFGEFWANVYSSDAADYPVTKVLQDPVYVEVCILERTDPNIVILLEHCWATSTSSPLSLPQWSLLVDGETCLECQERSSLMNRRLSDSDNEGEGTPEAGEQDSLHFSSFDVNGVVRMTHPLLFRETCYWSAVQQGTCCSF